MINAQENKSIPVKIQWSETARGFYCPTCLRGTYNGNHKCENCGQKLKDSYGIKDKET